MDIYRQIHNLAEFGMIAGSYKVLYIDCTDIDGAPVSLSKASRYGCRFYDYGTHDLLFSIDGTIVSGYANRMRIEIPSKMTASLGDCCLTYIPYVTIGENTVKYGKGRILVEGDTV